MKKLVSALVTIITVIVADRLTKAWAVKNCSSEQVYTWWLSCQTTFNRGVSWSLFHDVSPIIYHALTFFIMALIIALLFYVYKRLSRGFYVIAESLICAGALSNLFDRVWYGGVIDFIVIHYKDWVWPVFNVADCAIVGGVLILLFVVTYEE